jgi:hypothetical protein
MLEKSDTKDKTDVFTNTTRARSNITHIYPYAPGVPGTDRWTVERCSEGHEILVLVKNTKSTLS